MSVAAPSKDKVVSIATPADPIASAPVANPVDPAPVTPVAATPTPTDPVASAPVATTPAAASKTTTSTLSPHAAANKAAANSTDQKTNCTGANFQAGCAFHASGEAYKITGAIIFVIIMIFVLDLNVFASDGLKRNVPYYLRKSTHQEEKELKIA